MAATSHERAMQWMPTFRLANRSGFRTRPLAVSVARARFQGHAERALGLYPKFYLVHALDRIKPHS